MNVLSLFDGISCGRVALERAGVAVTNYYASEIDRYATQVSESNYPDIVQLGDINNWQKWGDLDIDLIIGGSPCQGFSFAGKQLAFDDPRSALFWKFVEILNYYKPKYFLLENVRMKKEYQDVISKALGVEPVVINSSLVSAQNRLRGYWTNIPNVTQPADKGILLKDVLESPGVVGRMTGRRLNSEGKREDYNYSIPTVQRFEPRTDNKSGCLTTVRKDNTVCDHAGNLRYLTATECERLQTLPTWNIEVVACLDQLRNYVNVVKKNPKLQKLVGSVERLGLGELVNSARRNTNVNLPLIKFTAGDLVNIKIENQTSQCTNHSKTECTTTANIVGIEVLKSNLSVESFARPSVFTLGIRAATLPNGREVLLLKDNSSQILKSGSSVLNTSGEEIQLDVDDVMNFLNTCRGSNSIYTILSRLNMRNIEQMLKILYCYAETAIGGCTVSAIPIETISLLYEIPYTAAVSATQRYKMLGNAWTVDVLSHIFRGLL